MTTAKIYVPAAVGDAVHEKVQRKMADKYGGFTAYDARGGWVDGDGELVKEETKVYEVVAPSTADGGELYTFMLSLARDVKELTEESAVLAYVGASDDSDGETIYVD